jgi:hypothetical protein
VPFVNGDTKNERIPLKGDLSCCLCYIEGREKRGFELGKVVRHRPRGQARSLQPRRDPTSTSRNTAEALACCETGTLVVHLPWALFHASSPSDLGIHKSATDLKMVGLLVHDARQAVEQRPA